MFYVAWQGNFEAWPFTYKTLNCSCNLGWDPHFAAVEALILGGAPGPVKIAYSSLYQWWYTNGLVYARTKIFILELFSYYSPLPSISFITGRLAPSTTPVETKCFMVSSCFISSHSSFVGTLWRESALWLGRDIHAIPEPRGEHIPSPSRKRREFQQCITISPAQGLEPLFIGQWNLYAQKPDSSSNFTYSVPGRELL